MPDLELILRATGCWVAETLEGEFLGAGSCWVVGHDLVVTNLHVASMGPRATVELEGMPAMRVLGLVAVDRPRDLAVARLRTGNRQLVPMAVNEGLPSIGTEVFVVGSPLGLRQSVSRGIVSSIRSTSDLEAFGVHARRTDKFVQIDAAISPGSSGGPIIGPDGRVVAVSTLLIAGGQALNFGVPAEYVAELIDVAGSCTPLDRFVDASQPSSPVVAVSHPVSAGPGTGFDSVLRLYLLVARADGEVTHTEDIVISRCLEMLGYPTHELHDAIERLVRDVQDMPDEDLAFEAAIDLDGLSDDVKDKILADLVFIAQSDGVTPEEESIIEQVNIAWER